MRKLAEIFAFGLPLTLASALATAQVPVDDSGNPIGAYQAASPQAAVGAEDIPLLTQTELQDLVGPVALYPDDLLAIVLPASTYPLQVVQAARFLEDLESDPSLQPDADWDDSIIALINYPEVVELLNEDLDWTWQLGEAVVAQQPDVVAAIETFRNRAYAAGNLRSDSYQQVDYDDGIIEITPVNDDIIYVPYYEPETVVIRQPRRVYYYYPDPCPVYYYPYPDSYSFRRGYFWGVTTAFTIGWATDRLRVYHPSYIGHPYYGRHYWNRWYYRRPSITVYNTIYINNRRDLAARRYTHGDYWRPSRHTRLRYSDQRITRTRSYSGGNRTVSHRRFVTNDTRNRVHRESTRRDTRVRRDSDVRRDSNVRRDTSVRHQSDARRDANVRRDRSERRDTTVRRDRSERRDTNVRRDRSERRDTTVRRDTSVRRETTARRDTRPSATQRSSQRTQSERRAPTERRASRRDRPAEQNRQARERQRTPPPQRESRRRSEQKEARRDSERRSGSARSQRTREARTRQRRITQDQS